jgi:RNA polymerase primary sigma factor
MTAHAYPAEAEPLLSTDEVVELQRAIEAGLLAGVARRSGQSFADATEDELTELEAVGERARQRFIQANLRLVGMVARGYAIRSRMSEADLFQEGCVGLIIAVERFDHVRGYRFSTYALYWIRAMISAAAARQLGGINLPTSRAEQLRAARGREAELVQSLGRQPSVRELAEVLGRSESWTAGLLAHQRPQAMEVVDDRALDLVQAVDELDAVLLDGRPGRELLARLDGLGRAVLELRLGFADGQPRSFAAVARTLGISVSRARRVEERALETLRGICPQQASAHL